MRKHTGEWHVIYIEEMNDDDDWDPQVLHPNSCGITYTDGFGLQRICGIEDEISNIGFDTMLPEGNEVGWFRVQSWVDEIPGNPNWGSGFTELDGGIEVEGLRVVSIGDET